MEKFIVHTGLVVPLDRENVDTDAIIPKQFLKSIKKTGFGPHLFDAWRYLDIGEPGMDISNRKPNPDFVLNKPQFQNPGILVSGNNFGAGSSREAAVWGMLANNIRVIVAKSFADIYRENCLQNGLLPVVLPAAEADVFITRVVAVNGAAPFTVDLQTQTISGPGGSDIIFDIAPADRMRLLEGLDDIGLTLKHTDEIVAFEKRVATAQPWLQTAIDSRVR